MYMKCSRLKTHDNCLHFGISDAAFRHTLPRPKTSSACSADLRNVLLLGKAPEHEDDSPSLETELQMMGMGSGYTP